MDYFSRCRHNQQSHASALRDGRKRPPENPLSRSSSNRMILKGGEGPFLPARKVNFSGWLVYSFARRGLIRT
jgi:hypothetical protein